MAIPEALLTALRQSADAPDSGLTDFAPEQYLETEWEELVVLLQRIVQKTAQAQENSRQFLSNVSHELRTPITVICGYLEAILDGTIPQHQQTETLFIIDQELHRLNNMVTSMLNLSKLENGQLHLQRRWFTWNDLAFRTIWFFQSRLKKRNIQTKGLDSTPVRIYADQDLMGQILFNLIENAVKYTNTGGTITFMFTETPTDWHMTLRNTGKGIPKAEQARLFQRFYQSAASQSSDSSGLGLGLDLVRRLVQLHQGQVSVCSEENAYTAFEIKLPRISRCP